MPAEGVLLGGQNPVAGSTVTLYRAGTSFGAGAVALGSATTDQNGVFSIDFTDPPVGTLLYITAIGGDSGGGSNSAIGMMAVIGKFGSLPGSFFQINELTTVASVYAMAQFMSADGRTIGGPPTSPGLDNAALTVTNLVDVITGGAAAFLSTGNNAPDKLNTAANILAPCINSSGPTSSACTSLFTEATPIGGTAPTDTLEAALSIALNPANNVSALFELTLPNDPFQPTLSSAPTDWTIALNHTAGGLNKPRAIAIDSSGNVWVTNQISSGSVTKLSPDGTAASGSPFTGGSIKSPVGIAIDASGNVWVANHKLGADSVTELDSSGTPTSGTPFGVGGGLKQPFDIAIDGSGDIWISDKAGGTGSDGVSKLDASGTVLATQTGGGLKRPQGIAIDGSGNVWLANQGTGANGVTELDSTGNPVTGSPFAVGGGQTNTWDIAVDGSGNIWVANKGGGAGTDGVTKLDSSGTAVATATNGGLLRPEGIAADGSGRVWITNNVGDSVTELKPDATPISPDSTGFTAEGLEGVKLINAPAGVAIDPSGNVWVANNLTSGAAKNSVTELVGAATPVGTPVIGPPQLP